MAKLSAFLFISLDGYYKDINDGFSWHRHSDEQAEFSAKSSQQAHILLFGRKTYEVMVNFWPTSMAKEQMPEVAIGNN
jgi:dihydrofolate reductase